MRLLLLIQLNTRHPRFDQLGAKKKHLPPSLLLHLFIYFFFLLFLFINQQLQIFLTNFYFYLLLIP